MNARYVHLQRLAVEHPVTELCALLAVRRGGYYAWHGPRPQPPPALPLADHRQPAPRPHRPPNRPAETPAPTRPNQVWATDFTCLPTSTGWLFLAVVLDHYSRRVVGWAFSAQIDTALALAALRMALTQRRPPAGLLHHSDLGSQYASAAYRAELAAHGLVASMSRAGNPYDNAVLESFYSTLKTEWLAPHPL